MEEKLLINFEICALMVCMGPKINFLITKINNIMLIDYRYVNCACKINVHTTSCAR